MSGTDLRLNRDIIVRASANGLEVDLTFVIFGQPDVGSIRLSRAEAIQVCGNTNASSRIPIVFELGDASAYGSRLMRFAADA
jgi:hypothetical protein